MFFARNVVACDLRFVFCVFSFNERANITFSGTISAETVFKL